MTVFTLPADLQGFAAAIETQDDELPITWAGIRDTVYGMLAGQTRAIALYEAAAESDLAGKHNRAERQRLMARQALDLANMLGYAFAEIEFDDIAERRGIDPTNETYDGFVNQRLAHAEDDTEEDSNEDR